MLSRFGCSAFIGLECIYRYETHASAASNSSPNQQQLTRGQSRRGGGAAARLAPSSQRWPPPPPRSWPPPAAPVSPPPPAAAAGWAAAPPSRAAGRAGCRGLPAPAPAPRRCCTKHGSRAGKRPVQRVKLRLLQEGQVAAVGLVVLREAGDVQQRRARPPRQVEHACRVGQGQGRGAGERWRMPWGARKQSCGAGLAQGLRGLKRTQRRARTPAPPRTHSRRAPTSSAAAARVTACTSSCSRLPSSFGEAPR